MVNSKTIFQYNFGIIENLCVINIKRKQVIIFNKIIFGSYIYHQKHPTGAKT